MLKRGDSGNEEEEKSGTEIVSNKYIIVCFGTPDHPPTVTHSFVSLNLCERLATCGRAKKKSFQEESAIGMARNRLI